MEHTPEFQRYYRSRQHFPGRARGMHFVIVYFLSFTRMHIHVPSTISCVGSTIHCYLSQASKLTQTVTGPVGPVTPRIYWSCEIVTGPTIFPFEYKSFTDTC